jgi:hypothetical protein
MDKYKARSKSLGNIWWDLLLLPVLDRAREDEWCGVHGGCID